MFVILLVHQMIRICCEMIYIFVIKFADIDENSIWLFLDSIRLPIKGLPSKHIKYPIPSLNKHNRRIENSKFSLNIVHSFEEVKIIGNGPCILIHSNRTTLKSYMLPKNDQVETYNTSSAEEWTKNNSYEWVHFRTPMLSGCKENQRK